MDLAQFAVFKKTETLPDGTIKVYGIASSETKDHDGEIITADAMRKAMPKYMSDFANVREMHQPIAAGVAIPGECYVSEKGVTHFGAHIVDKNTIDKVKAGVLKGFSIAGRAMRDTLNKAIIIGVDLTEISLVDRPCNPDALVSLWKRQTDVEKGSYTQSGEMPADQAVATPGTTVSDITIEAQNTPQAVTSDTASNNFDGSAHSANVESNSADGAGASVTVTENNMPDDGVPPATAEHATKAETLQRALEAIQAEDLTMDMLNELLKGTKTTEVVAEVKPAVAKRSKLQQTFAALKDQENINKGLYSVGSLADAICSLYWLTECAEDEAEMEGDGSAVPGRLKAVLNELGSILVAMAQEEVAELLGTVSPADSAVKVLKNLVDTKIHKQFVKAVTVDEPFTKLSSEVETLKKALADRDTKHNEQLVLLQKVLETTARPSLVVSTVAVSKDEDVSKSATTTIAPVVDEHGKVDEFATMMKKVLATGGAPIAKNRS